LRAGRFGKLELFGNGSDQDRLADGFKLLELGVGEDLVGVGGGAGHGLDGVVLLLGFIPVGLVFGDGGEAEAGGDVRQDLVRVLGEHLLVRGLRVLEQLGALLVGFQ